MSSPLRVATAATFVAIALVIASSPAVAQTCPTCVPLDDAGGPPHLGVWPLGLYPGASNVPPPAHAALAAAAAASVVPRDAAGAPSASGWIGMLSIGMSNCNQEFAAFERFADTELSRNARLIVVDGAVGGQSAEVIVDPSDPYWDVVDDRVRVAGLDPDQVQVVWLKQADGMVLTTAFPAHAETLQAHVRGIVRHLKDVFPNLQLCFLGSRIYGGYGSNPARTEPLSYEGGFAMRWLIEDQIAGDPDLNPDASAGPVEAPVLLWGPYLWANGTTPRASDGLTWQLADLESDFIHPSPSGEAKVKVLLHSFMFMSAYASPWYLADPGVDLDTLEAVADAHVDLAWPTTNFGGSGVLQWAWSGMRAYVKFDLEAVTGSVLHAKLSMMLPPNTADRPIEVVGVSNTTWNEATITASTAPAFDLAVVDTIPQASRGTAVGVDVTAEVLAALAQAPGSRRVTFGLRALPGPAAIQEVLSRESGEGPWLVLTTSPVTTAVEDAVRDPRSGLVVSARPNPVRGAADIRLDSPHALARASVAVFDVRGGQVRTLHAAALGSGRHEWRWDGRDDRGNAAPAGIYWVRAAGEGLTARAKLVRLP